jgi:hypothetical protein
LQNKFKKHKKRWLLGGKIKISNCQNKNMKQQKTWLTVHFYKGKSTIELTINYKTKKFSMTHDNNDNNVTFNGASTDFKVHTDRVKCITAALLFAKKELE